MDLIQEFHNNLILNNKKGVLADLSDIVLCFSELDDERPLTMKQIEFRLEHDGVDALPKEEVLERWRNMGAQDLIEIAYYIAAFGFSYIRGELKEKKKSRTAKTLLRIFLIALTDAMVDYEIEFSGKEKSSDSDVSPTPKNEWPIFKALKAVRLHLALAYYWDDEAGNLEDNIINLLEKHGFVFPFDEIKLD